MEFTKNYCTYKCHTLRVNRPPKVLLRPLSQTFLRISKQYFVFVSSPKKKNHAVATIVLTLLIYIVQRTNCKVAFWFGAIARKGEYTVIGRSFACSADIVAWPVQRRFTHRGKFQKLLNDRGETKSNLGYSTSFPRNQKQQCRNRVH